MGSVQRREQARGHVGESGIFARGNNPAAASESRAATPEPVAAELEVGALDAKLRDPVLQAFSEIRRLNTELQRANDALHGVNEALRTKVEQMRGTALDLEQMLDGLEVGVLLLDEELVVRHFNDMAAHFLALEAYDLGGSISAICRGSGPRLSEWCREVLLSGRRIRRTFHSAIGEMLSLQVRRTRVDGELRLILVFAETP
jgi:nitrogen fixation/metabolism regulation signal transduction histidine kinase